MNKNTFFIIVLLILIGGFVYYFSKSISLQGQTGKSEEQIPITSQNDSQNVPQKPGLLVFASKEAEVTSIFTYNLETKVKNKIFTDADESLKIKRLSNVTADGQNFLALLGEAGDQPTATAYLISTNGKGTLKKLVDGLTTFSSPVVSTDGKQIAYVTFSNAEKDYGFSLNLSNLDGSNKKTLLRDPTGLSFPYFSPDGKNLAVVKNTDTGSEIVVINLATATTKTILESSGNQISALSWSKFGFVFIQIPKKEGGVNLSEVYTCKEDGKDLKKLTSNNTAENYPFTSLDGSKVAFVVQAFEKETLKESTKATVNLADISGQNVQKLTEGDIILGWKE